MGGAGRPYRAWFRHRYEPEAAARRRGHSRYHSRYDYGYGGYGYGGAWRERDTAVPVHRWQGLLAEPTGGEHDGEEAFVNRTGEDALVSLTGGERVLGVALGAMAVRTALWRALGGLNESLPPDHAALDLSLRARLLGRHMTVYVSASVVVRRSRPEGDPAAMAEESGLASLFEARWGAELEARFSPLAACYVLATCYLLLATCYLLLATCYLATCYLLLATCYLLLATHHFTGDLPAARRHAQYARARGRRYSPRAPAART